MSLDVFLFQPDPCYHIQVSSGENAPEANERDGAFAKREGEREREVAALHM